MSLLQDDHAYELLGALVAESPADETEASLECVEERVVRFTASGPTEAVDRERYVLTLRARFEVPGGGISEARAACGTLDRHEARAALARAVTLARLAAPRGSAVPLGGPVDVPGTAPERPTQDHTFREKCAWIARALERAEAEGLRGAGHVSTLVANRTLVNSAGRRVHAARSRAAFAFTASDGDGVHTGRGGAGSAERIEANVDRIDVDTVIARAIDTALATRDPVGTAARPCAVVFEPRAVAALLLAADFGPEAFAEGRSFLTGRVGERIFPDLLRLGEDPAGAGSTGWVFDGEGTPVSRIDLLRDGAFTGPVTDARWAQALGRPNTGHAPLGTESGGPRTQHLALAPGHHALSELVATTRDGLLVADLRGVAVRETRDLVLTAATRHGTFRIVDGRLAGPVRDLEFTDSLVELLTRVTGVGASPERCHVPGAGECTVPALRIDGVGFTAEAPR